MPIKGLDAIRESLAARAATSPTGGVPELTLVPGEVALMHFLTDRDDIIEVRYHRLPETTSRGNIITREKLCRQEVSEPCSHCSHPSEDIRRSTLRWYAWVFVYCILTATSIEGAEKIVRGARTLNVWKLNEPAILRKGEGNNKYIVQQLLSHSERYGSLCGRIFEWERTGGTRQDTTYMLSPLPDLVAKPEVALPLSLEEIISKEMALSPFPVRQRQQQVPTSLASILGTGAAAQVLAPKPIAEPGSSVSRLMDLLKGKQDKPRL